MDRASAYKTIKKTELESAIEGVPYLDVGRIRFFCAAKKRYPARDEVYRATC